MVRQYSISRPDSISIAYCPDLACAENWSGVQYIPFDLDAATYDNLIDQYLLLT
ncbi:MAG: hypothetical protein H6766_01110 [Candidatus Peribacteria bacterium]|nr:MAG: hypothetical protein H6766_01110 [Candidatus Peribacteria bacterium]